MVILLTSVGKNSGFEKIQQDPAIWNNTPTPNIFIATIFREISYLGGILHNR